MNLTLKEIILSTGGELIHGRPDTIVASISTDTRALQPGDLFVALKGPNFDGSQFTADAFERGAIGALVSGLPEGLQISDGECLVSVENTEKALGDIALLWRRKISADVLVVMGSSGKTTTREMIFQSLAAAFQSPDRRLFISANGNLNNTIGVPLTLFQIEPDTQLIVTEIGMNSKGEIRRLTEITDPGILVVT
ncbi:MAG: Mur ligase family protein, partial [Candidatus Sumerlaeota bacterium]|nr:Mur ligase family protein [Candidatus Sumerlaeota bacterium]